MQLQFEHPYLLLLWPVLAAVIIWSARWMRSKSPTRRIGETALRCLILLLAVAACAGPSIKKTGNMTTTIFLVDLSDSMSDSWSEEADFVKSAIADMPAKNQSGIVVFGADSRVEQFVSNKKAFTSFQTQAVSTATNLEQAVQTAIALFPDDSAKRLVLLTDGRENEGDLTRMNAICRASGDGNDTEIKVVRYEEVIGDEVYVSDVTMPDTIHEGDQFQVKVTVFASVATEATVSLYSGRTLKGQRQVSLQKGDNQLVFTDQGVETGLKSYRVTVDAAKDTLTVNNSYSAFTSVEAKTKLLVVEGKVGEADAFKKVLDACNYNYDVVGPSAVPNKIADLTQYQSVVMLDVYADDLRNGFLDIIETYVKDYAGGLVVLGGENSYALGNYRNTSLEDVLPVSMDLEGEKEVPSVAMVMVIDHSGSMTDASTMNSTVSCLTVAKQAAVNALDSMREIDQVGVIAFDDAYTWVVDLQNVTDPDTVMSQIGTISGGGGTNIYPAVVAAAEKLKTSSAAIKHIVLLTDGQDGYNKYDPLIQDLNESGITLSTVAVGTGADTSMLESLAEKCGGRYYYSDADSNMPRIFAQEVYMSTKSYLKNEEFTPTIVNSHEIISGIFDNGSPSLKGYIATSAKSNSTVILESDEEDPILAVWQYGLGKAVAWTSDGSGEWTGNFSGWDNYASLWQNIIDWSISDSDLGGDTLKVTQEASSAVLNYQTSDYDADTEISAVITGEDGEQKEVTLKASKPGTYTAEVPLDETGVYTINVRNSENGEVVKSANTATAMQYSREYRYGESTASLDSFIEAVGASVITTSDEVFNTKLTGAVSRTEITVPLLIAALILFILDTICRRMRVDWISAISAGLGKVFRNVFHRPSGRNKRRKVGNVDNLSISGNNSVEKTGKSVNKRIKNVDNPVNNSPKDINRDVHSEDKSARTAESDGKDVRISESMGKAGSTDKTGGWMNSGKTDNKTTKKASAARSEQTPIAKTEKAPAKGKKKQQADTIDTAALLNKKKKRDS